MTFNTKNTIYKLLVTAALCTSTVFSANAQQNEDDRNDEAQYINATGLWGRIDYNGEPWVRNLSAPNKVTHGLQGRHISLWASHGIYYKIEEARWKWQRPKLFCTTEDLFTQTIVVPYLIPMLERAGAYVFTPRERDWQRHEVIVDNDNPRPLTSYIEVNGKQDWETADSAGFAIHAGYYHDGENPFRAGTVRQAKTISKKSNESIISYNPTFPKAGRYAVYVSYCTVKKSIDNAQYTVYHKGEATTFSVNQQMGGGTWVYLGTFDFDEGESEGNRVVLSNYSNNSGVVTADAVRFGGGMGNIERGGETSGMPRCLEGARYYAQWAGMPYDVYSSKNGQDDYGDDINARSLMTNYLGGGSVYMPTLQGKKVPIELSLALHSDAGYYTEDEIMGTLSICTTQHNEGRLNSGISRNASKTLAYQLRRNAMEEMRKLYGNWRMRYMWDRNYSESRTPEVPSAILEMMSHQNFTDMRMAQDPNFKFSLARTIYKTILKYICTQHNKPYVVAPLTPHNFVLHVDEGKLKITATPTQDNIEPTATTTSYIIYKAEGDNGFDNGTEVERLDDYTLEMQPNVLYNFRIAAANSGGVSQQSEMLSALWNPNAKARVMIVNGFHRLSSPAVINDESKQGFDMSQDPGLTLGSTFGWVGRQLNFNRSGVALTGAAQLGWSDDTLSGMLIAGNTQDYVRCHAEALAATGEYTITSCQSDAVDNGIIDIAGMCDAVDLLLGIEEDDGHSLVKYKTFSPRMQQCLKDYAAQGGAILVSGANVASDMKADTEKAFLEQILKCRHAGKVNSPNNSLSGMGLNFTYHHDINEEHYAALHPDVLEAVGDGYGAIIYNGIGYAAVVYNGKDYRTMTLGFPMECIRESDKRETLFRDIFRFLTFKSSKKK